MIRKQRELAEANALNGGNVVEVPSKVLNLRSKGQKSQMETRAIRHSIKAKGAQPRGRQKLAVGIIAVESCGNAAVEFEFSETAFDVVASFIEFWVVRDGGFAIGFGGDDRWYLRGRTQGADGIGVVAPIRDYGPLALPPCRGPLAAGLLPTVEQEA